MSLANLMRRGALREATQPQAPQGAATVARVATVAVAIAPNDPMPLVNDPEFSPSDLDRWCWPATEAMNGAEVDRMIDRVNVFVRRGMAMTDAEVLADALVKRDREDDDRRVCMECANLRGRHCGKPVQAGMGGNVGQVALILQRCPAFQPVGDL